MHLIDQLPPNVRLSIAPYLPHQTIEWVARAIKKKGVIISIIGNAFVRGILPGFGQGIDSETGI